MEVGISLKAALLLAAALALGAVPRPVTTAAEPLGLGMKPARFLPKEERQAAEDADAQPSSSPELADTGQRMDDPRIADALRNDAALADVCFVDREHGWAVGDRGAIWHTRDGGLHWTSQESGVNCRLHSVSFIDSKRGWAAGGDFHPYLHTGSGVLLFTEDGGRQWNRHGKLLLPPLKRIRFFGPRSGIAIGVPSALFPSGVFVTETGGRSWDPLPGIRPLGEQVGDFLDPQTGALFADRQAAYVARRGLVHCEQAMQIFGLRAPKRLELTPPNGGWVVGHGGAVWRTADLGATWHAPPNDPASLGANQFDFAALAVRGPKCWIAGDPGTKVFFTPDAGFTWSAFLTGQNLPLHALCFVDDEHGWAVGALGTILATSDGGRTWRLQRSGGSRVVVLGVFTQPDDVPWELFARLSGNEGYLATVACVCRRDAEVCSRDEVPMSDRLHEAAVRVGACAGIYAWQFPLRQPGLEMSSAQILRAWDAMHQGRGRESLESYLIRLIRTWRPDVVITHDSAADTDAARILAQAAMKAAAEASEPNAAAELIASTGLAAWQVKRVVAALGPSAHGTLQVTAGQIADRLGRTLGEMAMTARGLVEDRFRPAPPSQGFSIAADLLVTDRGGRDFLSGINHAFGSEGRRFPPAGPLESPELVRRLAQRRQNALAIIQRRDVDARADAALVAEARDLARTFDSSSAAALLFQLAESYHARGNWDLAADVFEALYQDYVNEPLSCAAQSWLIEYYASGEAKRRRALREPSGVVQASAVLGASRFETDEERAVALANMLQQTRPDLLAQPRVGFPLAAVQRRTEPRLAERFYAAQRTGAVDPAWRRSAQLEQWLREPRGVPPKPVFRCRMAASRPYLDAVLDDPVWQQAESATLQSLAPDDATRPAAVRMAYDREFLYVAIEAQKCPGFRYEEPSGPRRRDADLTAQDRVEVCLDIDRDYATYYRFAVDHRGFTRDDCWGDATWDPAWFVAAKSTDSAWIAEIAIPLDQLSGRSPQQGDAWAVGIQRIVQGIGFQSFNDPAAADPIPEGFGCLLFE